MEQFHKYSVARRSVWTGHTGVTPTTGITADISAQSQHPHLIASNTPTHKYTTASHPRIHLCRPFHLFLPYVALTAIVRVTQAAVVFLYLALMSSACFLMLPLYFFFPRLNGKYLCFIICLICRFIVSTNRIQK